MKSMHSNGDSRAITARAGRLAPGAPPRWGRMSAPQMMVHITDAMRMATGELAVRAKKHPARLPPLKQLLIYVVPMAKGLPTAPELLARAPESIDSEIEAFRSAVERFVACPPGHVWPDHPIFGSMSRAAWGVLAYKHCDHHLTQFGV